MRRPIARRATPRLSKASAVPAARAGGVAPAGVAVVARTTAMAPAGKHTSVNGRVIADEAVDRHGEAPVKTATRATEAIEIARSGVGLKD